MVRFPLTLHRSKPDLGMPLQILSKGGGQCQQQLVSINHTCMLFNGCPKLIYSRRLNHIDIDADADNYVTYIRGVASQLKQNPCDLAAINVYVVRPLDARLRDADLM